MNLTLLQHVSPISSSEDDKTARMVGIQPGTLISFVLCFQNVHVPFMQLSMQTHQLVGGKACQF